MSSLILYLIKFGLQHISQSQISDVNSLFDSISIAPPSSRFFKLIIDNIYNEYYKHGTKSIKGIFIDKYNKFRPLVNLVPAAITYIPESDNHINLFTNNAQISNELIIFNLLQNIKNKK